MKREEDYVAKARASQRKALNSLRSESNENISKDFLNAANFWRKSIKQNINSKRLIFEAKKGMDYCYTQAANYTSSPHQAELIRQEKNYAKLNLTELAIREKLNDFVSKYKNQYEFVKTNLNQEDLGELISIGNIYFRLANNLDIPQKYRESEERDLLAKGNTIKEHVKRIKNYQNKTPRSLATHLQNTSRKNIIQFPISYHQTQNLDRKLGAVSSFVLLAGSIFFSTMSVTGNVIGGVTENSSRIIGLCLFVCGLVFSFVFLNKRKRLNF